MIIFSILFLEILSFSFQLLQINFKLSRTLIINNKNSSNIITVTCYDDCIKNNESIKIFFYKIGENKITYCNHSDSFNFKCKIKGFGHYILNYTFLNENFTIENIFIIKSLESNFKISNSKNKKCYLTKETLSYKFETNLTNFNFKNIQLYLYSNSTKSSFQMKLKNYKDQQYANYVLSQEVFPGDYSIIMTNNDFDNRIGIIDSIIFTEIKFDNFFFPKLQKIIFKADCNFNPKEKFLLTQSQNTVSFICNNLSIYYEDSKTFICYFQYHLKNLFYGKTEVLYSNKTLTQNLFLSKTLNETLFKSEINETENNIELTIENSDPNFYMKSIDELYIKVGDNYSYVIQKFHISQNLFLNETSFQINIPSINYDYYLFKIKRRLYEDENEKEALKLYYYFNNNEIIKKAKLAKVTFEPNYMFIKPYNEVNNHSIVKLQFDSHNDLKKYVASFCLNIISDNEEIIPNATNRFNCYYPNENNSSYIFIDIPTLEPGIFQTEIRMFTISAQLNIIIIEIENICQNSYNQNHIKDSVIKIYKFTDNDKSISILYNNEVINQDFNYNISLNPFSYNFIKFIIPSEKIKTSENRNIIIKYDDDIVENINISYSFLNLPKLSQKIYMINSYSENISIEFSNIITNEDNIEDSFYLCSKKCSINENNRSISCFNCDNISDLYYKSKCNGNIKLDFRLIDNMINENYGVNEIYYILPENKKLIEFFFYYQSSQLNFPTKVQVNGENMIKTKTEKNTKYYYYSINKAGNYSISYKFQDDEQFNNLNVTVYVRDNISDFFNVLKPEKQCVYYTDSTKFNLIKTNFTNSNYIKLARTNYKMKELKCNNNDCSFFVSSDENSNYKIGKSIISLYSNYYLNYTLLYQDYIIFTNISTDEVTDSLDVIILDSSCFLNEKFYIQKNSSEKIELNCTNDLNNFGKIFCVPIQNLSYGLYNIYYENIQVSSTFISSTIENAIFKANQIETFVGKNKIKITSDLFYMKSITKIILKDSFSKSLKYENSNDGKSFISGFENGNYFIELEIIAYPKRTYFIQFFTEKGSSQVFGFKKKEEKISIIIENEIYFLSNYDSNLLPSITFYDDYSEYIQYVFYKKKEDATYNEKNKITNRKLLEDNGYNFIFNPNETGIYSFSFSFFDDEDVIKYEILDKKIIVVQSIYEILNFNPPEKYQLIYNDMNIEIISLYQQLSLSVYITNENDINLEFTNNKGTNIYKLSNSQLVNLKENEIFKFIIEDKNSEIILFSKNIQFLSLKVESLFYFPNDKIIIYNSYLHTIDSLSLSNRDITYSFNQSKFYDGKLEINYPSKNMNPGFYYLEYEGSVITKLFFSNYFNQSVIDVYPISAKNNVIIKSNNYYLKNINCIIVSENGEKKIIFNSLNFNYNEDYNYIQFNLPFTKENDSYILLEIEGLDKSKKKLNIPLERDLYQNFSLNSKFQIIGNEKKELTFNFNGINSIDKIKELFSRIYINNQLANFENDEICQFSVDSVSCLFEQPDNFTKFEINYNEFENSTQYFYYIVFNLENETCITSINNKGIIKFYLDFEGDVEFDNEIIKSENHYYNANIFEFGFHYISIITDEEIINIQTIQYYPYIQPSIGTEKIRVNSSLDVNIDLSYTDYFKQESIIINFQMKNQIDGKITNISLNCSTYASVICNFNFSYFSPGFYVFQMEDNCNKLTDEEIIFLFDNKLQQLLSVNPNILNINNKRKSIQIYLDFLYDFDDIYYKYPISIDLIRENESNKINFNINETEKVSNKGIIFNFPSNLLTKDYIGNYKIVVTLDDNGNEYTNNKSISIVELSLYENPQKIYDASQKEIGIIFKNEIKKNQIKSIFFNHKLIEENDYHIHENLKNVLIIQNENKLFLKNDNNILKINELGNIYPLILNLKVINIINLFPIEYIINEILCSYVEEVHIITLNFTKIETTEESEEIKEEEETTEELEEIKEEDEEIMEEAEEIKEEEEEEILKAEEEILIGEEEEILKEEEEEETKDKEEWIIKSIEISDIISASFSHHIYKKEDNQDIYISIFMDSSNITSISYINSGENKSITINASWENTFVVKTNISYGNLIFYHKNSLIIENYLFNVYIINNISTFIDDSVKECQINYCSIKKDCKNKKSVDFPNFHFKKHNMNIDNILIYKLNSTTRNISKSNWSPINLISKINYNDLNDIYNLYIIRNDSEDDEDYILFEKKFIFSDLKLISLNYDDIYSSIITATFESLCCNQELLTLNSSDGKIFFAKNCSNLEFNIIECYFEITIPLSNNYTICYDEIEFGIINPIEEFTFNVNAFYSENGKGIFNILTTNDKYNSLIISSFTIVDNKNNSNKIIINDIIYKDNNNAYIEIHKNLLSSEIYIESISLFNGKEFKIEKNNNLIIKFNKIHSISNNYFYSYNNFDLISFIINSEISDISLVDSDSIENKINCNYIKNNYYECNSYSFLYGKTYLVNFYNDILVNTVNYYHKIINNNQIIIYFKSEKRISSIPLKLYELQTNKEKGNFLKINETQDNSKNYILTYSINVTCGYYYLEINQTKVIDYFIKNCGIFSERNNDIASFVFGTIYTLYPYEMFFIIQFNNNNLVIPIENISTIILEENNITLEVHCNSLLDNNYILCEVPPQINITGNFTLKYIDKNGPKRLSQKIEIKIQNKNELPDLTKQLRTMKLGNYSLSYILEGNDIILIPDINIYNRNFEIIDKEYYITSGNFSLSEIKIVFNEGFHHNQILEIKLIKVKNYNDISFNQIKDFGFDNENVNVLYFKDNNILDSGEYRIEISGFTKKLYFHIYCVSFSEELQIQKFGFSENEKNIIFDLQNDGFYILKDIISNIKINNENISFKILFCTDIFCRITLDIDFSVMMNDNERKVFNLLFYYEFKNQFPFTVELNIFSNNYLSKNLPILSNKKEYLFFNLVNSSSKIYTNIFPYSENSMELITFNLFSIDFPYYQNFFFTNNEEYFTFSFILLSNKINNHTILIKNQNLDSNYYYQTLYYNSTANETKEIIYEDLECDKTGQIYIETNNKKKCVLCKEIDSLKPFKELNENKCVNKCSKGYLYEKHNECYEKCEEANTKRNLFVEEGKCVFECSENYGVLSDDDNICYQCNISKSIELNGKCIKKTDINYKEIISFKLTNDNLNSCEQYICENNGTCYMRNNEAYCSCPKDYYGNRCEMGFNSSILVLNSIIDSFENPKSYYNDPYDEIGRSYYSKNGKVIYDLNNERNLHEITQICCLINHIELFNTINKDKILKLFDRIENMIIMMLNGEIEINSNILYFIDLYVILVKNDIQNKMLNLSRMLQEEDLMYNEINGIEDFKKIINISKEIYKKITINQIKNNGFSSEINYNKNRWLYYMRWNLNGNKFLDLCKKNDELICIDFSNCKYDSDAIFIGVLISSKINQIINNYNYSTIFIETYHFESNNLIFNNINQCDNITTFIPSNIELKIGKYKEFIKENIDIYNPYEEAYNKTCYITKNLDYDITQKFRKFKIYENKTFESDYCLYDGIDIHYEKIKMKCKYNKNYSYSFHIQEKNLNISNKGVNIFIKCSTKIKGLYIVIIIFYIIFLTAIGILIFKKKNQIFIQNENIDDFIEKQINNINLEEKDKNKQENSKVSKNEDNDGNSSNSDKYIEIRRKRSSIIIINKKEASSMNAKKGNWEISKKEEKTEFVHDNEKSNEYDISSIKHNSENDNEKNNYINKNSNVNKNNNESNEFDVSEIKIENENENNKNNETTSENISVEFVNQIILGKGILTSENSNKQFEENTKESLINQENKKTMKKEEKEEVQNNLKNKKSFIINNKEEEIENISLNDEKKTEKQNSSIKNIKIENIKLKIIDDNNTELYSEIGEHININNINLEINDLEKEDNKIQTHYINNNFINKSNNESIEITKRNEENSKISEQKNNNNIEKKETFSYIYFQNIKNSIYNNNINKWFNLIFFIINVILIIGFNAIFYTENLIEKRIYDKKRNSIFYPIKNELIKIILSIILTISLNIIIRLIINLIYQNKEKEKSKKTLIEFIIKMIIILYFIFYFVIFSYFYRKTLKNLLVGGIFSLLIKLIVSQLYVFIISIIEFYKVYKFKDFLKYMKDVFYYI